MRAFINQIPAMTLIAAIGLQTACSGDSAQLPGTSLIASPSKPKDVQLSAVPGTQVNLDAHTEICSKKKQATFEWSLINSPSGSSASITDTTHALTVLPVDLVGQYLAEVSVVCDGVKELRGKYTITVTAPKTSSPSSNAKPIANAGADRDVKVGDKVYLDASASSDADVGDVLSSMWRLIAPNNSAAVLEDVSPLPSSPDVKLLNHAQKYFIPDQAGRYRVALKVNDGTIDSDEVTITVTVTENANAKPVANAGVDQRVQLGALVTLHSAGSHDADSTHSSNITYRWYVNNQPTGSSVALSSDNAAEPSFTPTVAGQYTLRLVVTDNRAASAEDFVIITVDPAAPMVSLRSKLMKLGLDDADAAYLETHHKADAEAVVALPSPIFFDGVVIDDSMFGTSASQGANLFSGVYPHLTTWEPRHKTRFKKIFGRINFVVNSIKFKDAFNAHILKLDKVHAGTGLKYPDTFDEFKTDSNAEMLKKSKQFTFLLSESTTGVAYGLTGLMLGVERMGMMGDASQDGKTKAWDVNGAAGLIFHELTHSIGYLHDPNDQTGLLPNNIPYYVQIIASYTTNIDSYCVNSGCKPPSVQYGTPDAIFTQYFGNN